MRKDQRWRLKKEASPDDADRTFPIGNHPNIIQGLNRKYNNRHLSLYSPDSYFPPDIAQFFYKRWPILLFYGRGFFFVWCCRKNLQCTSSRFLRSCSTEVVVWPTPACFHFLGNENISPPRKKTWFTDTKKLRTPLPRGSSLCEGMGEGCCTQPSPCICKEALSGFEPMTNKSPRHNFTAAPGLALTDTDRKKC